MCVSLIYKYVCHDGEDAIVYGVNWTYGSLISGVFAKHTSNQDPGKKKIELPLEEVSV